MRRMLKMIDNRLYYPRQHTLPEESNVMTVPELAEYLGIGRNSAYELLRSKTIRGFRIGKTWKVSKDAVDLYIRKNSGLV